MSTFTDIREALAADINARRREWRFMLLAFVYLALADIALRVIPNAIGAVIALVCVALGFGLLVASCRAGWTRNFGENS